jgi:hypothetical protein
MGGEGERGKRKKEKIVWRGTQSEMVVHKEATAKKWDFSLFLKHCFFLP